MHAEGRLSYRVIAALHRWEAFLMLCMMRVAC